MENRYIELYKKHRPRVFSDMIGQDSIVSTLRNTVLSKKIPTGFLFAGPAGTGKTTAALIFAKALNCENPQENGDPCNQCTICKAIDNNSQPGVKYISMANNGGVDEVRKIMEESRISQPINRKVFILDEIHNSSSAAQDSMLIELESERQSTIFICCTTDPDKIKPAILSRLQQRTFRRLDNEELVKNLVNICKKEPDVMQWFKEHTPQESTTGEFAKIKLAECAYLAQGSVRTSIANLETLISNGNLPTHFISKLLNAIFTGDVKQVFAVTEEASQHSIDFNRLAEQVYSSLVDIIKVKTDSCTSDKTRHQENLGSDIISTANKISGKTIIILINELTDTFKVVSNKVIDYRVLYEMCFVKMSQICRKEAKGNNEQKSTNN